MQTFIYIIQKWKKTTVGTRPNDDLEMMISRYSPTVKECLK